MNSNRSRIVRDVFSLTLRHFEARTRMAKSRSPWFTLSLSLSPPLILLCNLKRNSSDTDVFSSNNISPQSLSPLTVIFLSLDATLPMLRLHNKSLRLTQRKVRVKVWQRSLLIPSFVCGFLLARRILWTSCAWHHCMFHTVFCTSYETKHVFTLPRSYTHTHTHIHICIFFKATGGNFHDELIFPRRKLLTMQMDEENN
jgi:hypothetical protein